MNNMSKLVKWQNVKKSMSALNDEEKSEIDLMAEITAKTIERRQELGISQRDLEKIIFETNKIFEKTPLK